MRTISLLGWVAVFALAACTTTETNDSNLSHPPTSGDDDDGTTDPDKGTGVGTGGTDGEHGAVTPAGATSTPSGGTTVQSTTWTGTQDVPSNITIPAGQTITIQPGTAITMGANATITILGTLKLAGGASNHAKMTGTSWQGLIVGPSGTLDVDGLDISGAAAGIWTQAGNTAATYKDGVMTAQTPFKMEAGSTLTVDHSSITASSGSAIAGTFVATYMTYNKTTASGLTIADAAGTMTITDSTLTGAGTDDYVIANQATAVNVSYTTITGSHCGFHFQPAAKFTIDHVSVTGNSYGAMLYGSTTGGTITSSNFRANSVVDIDYTKSSVNGPVTIDSSFMTAPTNITPTNPATAQIADAAPRPDTGG